MAQPKPFKIAVSDELLAWITNRVKTARLPPSKDLPDDLLWKRWGVPTDHARHLQQYWTDSYDWRKVERELNADLKQFTLPIAHTAAGSSASEDVTMHFVHHRSPRKDAIPLLFAHGWPGSFLEVRPLIALLTEPASPDQQAYHVVAPSLPGFGFSGYPSKPCGPADMADMLHALMLALGYATFAAQAGDWGSLILRMLASRHPASLRALHLNMVVAGPPSPLWQPVALGRLILAFVGGGLGLTGFEKRALERMQWFRTWETGYQEIQGTKPLTLGYGLADSPIGMLCWVKDKVQVLVDDDFTWGDEEIITWVMPYIINGTAGHAELYKYSPRGDDKGFMADFSKPVPASVAFGASLFPKDVLYVPRWWADGTVAQKIIFWKEHDKGGHFPSVERPKVLAEDIRAFTAMLDKETMNSLLHSGL